MSLAFHMGINSILSCSNFHPAPFQCAWKAIAVGPSTRVPTSMWKTQKNFLAPASTGFWRPTCQTQGIAGIWGVDQWIENLCKYLSNKEINSKTKIHYILLFIFPCDLMVQYFGRAHLFVVVKWYHYLPTCVLSEYARLPKKTNFPSYLHILIHSRGAFIYFFNIS